MNEPCASVSDASYLYATLTAGSSLPCYRLQLCIWLWPHARRDDVRQSGRSLQVGLIFSISAIHPFKTRMTLPQPADASHRYTYVTAEDVAGRYFNSPSLEKDQLVWVLTSQGKRKKKQSSARSKEHDQRCDADASNANGDEDSSSGIRTELFLRARVVSQDAASDDEPRVLVRYPKGSTYHVRKSFLLPVLEPGVVTSDRLVLVVPETPEYRRASVVHTCVGESFLEIGSDYGISVDRVRKALSEVGAVPLVATATGDASQTVAAKEEDKNDDGSGTNRVACLGVDKSPESIEIAMKRYQDTTFSTEDALTDEGTAKMRALCKQKLVGGYPNVVAIDINGNRLLDHVVECVERVMNPGDDVVLGRDWDLPRLIIVKSRFLHEEVKRQQSR